MLNWLYTSVSVGRAACAGSQIFSDVWELDTKLQCAEGLNTCKPTFSDVCSINNHIYQYNDIFRSPSGRTATYQSTNTELADTSRIQTFSDVSIKPARLQTLLSEILRCKSENAWNPPKSIWTHVPCIYIIFSLSSNNWELICAILISCKNDAWIYIKLMFVVLAADLRVIYYFTNYHLSERANQSSPRVRIASYHRSLDTVNPIA